MRNRKLIEKTVNEYLKDITVGIYDGDVIDNFTYSQLNRIREKLKYGENADLKFIHKGKTIMIEIIFMYDEVDFIALSLSEYNNYFGDNTW